MSMQAQRLLRMGRLGLCGALGAEGVKHKGCPSGVAGTEAPTGQGFPGRFAQRAPHAGRLEPKACGLGVFQMLCPCPLGATAGAGVASTDQGCPAGTAPQPRWWDGELVWARGPRARWGSRRTTVPGTPLLPTLSRWKGVTNRGACQGLHPTESSSNAPAIGKVLGRVPLYSSCSFSVPQEVRAGVGEGPLNPAPICVVKGEGEQKPRHWAALPALERVLAGSPLFDGGLVPLHSICAFKPQLVSVPRGRGFSSLSSAVSSVWVGILLLTWPISFSLLMWSLSFVAQKLFGQASVRYK